MFAAKVSVPLFRSKYAFEIMAYRFHRNRILQIVEKCSPKVQADILHNRFRSIASESNDPGRQTPTMSLMWKIGIRYQNSLRIAVF